MLNSKWLAGLFLLLLAACNKPDDPPPPPPPPPPPLSSTKAITSFAFRLFDNSSFINIDANGVVGTDIITVELNEDTNLGSLVPVINHTGVSITPASGAAQNFNNTIE